MNKKLLKYLIPVAMFTIPGMFFIIPAIKILFLIFDKKTSDYRLGKFDLSEIPDIKTTDWNKRLNISPLPHIVLKNKNTAVKKYVFSTADCNIIKHGYKNQVELFIVFSSQGKIKNIILGKNIKTPRLIRKMRQRDFFQQWKNINNPEKIQFVTGATYSCKAVSEGISELLKLLKNEKFFK